MFRGSLTIFGNDNYNLLCFSGSHNLISVSFPDLTGSSGGLTNCANLRYANFPKLTTLNLGAALCGDCSSQIVVRLPKIETITGASLYSIGTPGGKVFIGKTLTSISGGIIHGCYFEHSDEDPVLFESSLSSWPEKGASKSTKSYTFYTDNTTIKNGLAARRDSYTTINIYHLDGTAWS